MRKKTLMVLVMALWCISLNAQHKVYVNGEKVSLEKLKSINDRYGIAIGDGNYWYDALSGAWGYQNGPTQGFLVTDLNVGGRLRSDASNGKTRVFVNGRQLPLADVRALQRIINVVPGRFWLDGQGNGGYEGMPSTFNLKYLARQKGASFYRNSYTGIGAGSSGGTSYVMGKDWSVIVD